MLRLALTRRWLAALAVCLVVAAGCVRAAVWQWSRYEQRTAINAHVSAAARADPVPVAALTGVGGGVPDTAAWRAVQARGRYDVAHQMLVRNRPLDGANGFYVLVPLVTDAGPAFLVNRGWVPSGATALTTPRVPAPPGGEVTVTARLRPSEPGPAASADLPAGQIRRIALDELAHRLPYPVYGGYGERVAERPAPGESPTPLPLPKENAALNLGYTVQWSLFAVIALVGWVVLVRREAAQPAPTGAARPTPTGAPLGARSRAG